MRNITSGVYLIFCTANQKAYVGSSKNIEKRWLRHKLDLRNRGHKTPHLQAAWSLYGESAFAFSILEKLTGTKEQLEEVELKWQDKYDCRNPERGFNVLLPGQAPVNKNGYTKNPRQPLKVVVISVGVVKIMSTTDVVNQLGVPRNKLTDILTFWKNYPNQTKKGGLKSWHGYVFVREENYNPDFNYLEAPKLWFKEKKTDDPDYHKNYDKARWAAYKATLGTLIEMP